MSAKKKLINFSLVALLAEGVDRNYHDSLNVITQIKSPSSRRAWIEISSRASTTQTPFVALLAEGVDRNLMASVVASASSGRPPRGGRG